MAIRVAIIDDHTLVREALVNACEASGFVEVVHQGDDIQAALELPVAPDVVLLDLELDGHEINAREARVLMDRGSRVIIVSATTKAHAVGELLREGADGFVSKLDATEDLLAAIASVHEGDGWVTPQLAAFIISDARRPMLSQQELTALKLYAAGLKIESVARRMNIAPSTAREYIARVRSKYAAVGRPAPTKVSLHENAKSDGFIP